MTFSVDENDIPNSEIKSFSFRKLFGKLGESASKFIESFSVSLAVINGMKINNSGRIQLIHKLDYVPESIDISKYEKVHGLSVKKMQQMLRESIGEIDFATIENFLQESVRSAFQEEKRDFSRGGIFILNDLRKEITPIFDDLYMDKQYEVKDFSDHPVIR